MIFHLIEYDFLLSFSNHTSFDSSVSILYFLWLKDLVWFLYRVLKSPSVSPMYFELCRLFQLLLDKPVLIVGNFRLKGILISFCSCRFAVVVLLSCAAVAVAVLKFFCYGL